MTSNVRGMRMLYDLGPRLASLRRKRNLTQQELVNRAKARDPHLRLTDSALGKYENDQSVPRLAEAAALADVLGVSLDYLASGEACDTLPVKGLTGEQTALIAEMIEMLRKANAGEFQTDDGTKPSPEQAMLFARMIAQFVQ